jgi:ParB family chromosome partitioning protein
MAAKPKLVLTPSTSIALDRLVPSPANVRRTNAAVSIEELAASIARRGLLQSLSVRPVLDGEGNETGTYEVQAGSRRMRALKLLMKQKRLAKDAPIPCIVKTTGIAEDDSLAENSDREALHPLDEFRAFAALREKGQSEDDIAAAFAVTPAVVRQRLKLASASPKLLDAYGGSRIALDQLMAFCVSDDHARQQHVLEMIERGQVNSAAYNIRRLLTESCVEADDPRARFVGLDAYATAGGTILRDLFEPDDGGWLQDPDLLMRLVSEKLAAARERVLAEGWKWAEAALETPYHLKSGLRRLRPIADALTDADEKRYLALSEEHDNLIEGLEDDESIPPDIQARLDAIDAELAEMDNRPPKFAPEDIARGGVLLSVAHSGQLQVEYGFLRPEDTARSANASEDNADEDASSPDGEDDDEAHTSTGHGGEDQGEEADGTKDLPDRLIQDLTSFRTIGLRNALADDYPTAFLAVLHAMCLDLFYRYGAHSCLQLKANELFPARANGLADMAAAKAIERRHERWQTKLPDDPRDLWAALVELDRQGSLGALFAHCASLTVNAVREPHQPRRDSLRHADTLAAALCLDMTAAGWVTGADNYLGRVTKAQILEAVREARGEDTARLIEHMKKGDMAKEAERLLQGTGWLPGPLRTPEPAAPATAPNTDGSEAPALPDFLTQDNAPDTDALRAAAE